MATRIDGDNITVPGQATVSGLPTNLLNVLRSKDVSLQRAYVQGLVMNTGAPADLASIALNSSKLIPVRAWVYNPSANHAAATLGIYSGAGATGVAIVTPVLLASLTGVDTFQVLAIAALSSVIKVSTLYPRLTVASANPGTASLVIEFEDLTLI